MDLAALSDDELIDQVTTWAGRVAAGQAVLLRLVGELDARGAWAVHGVTSCAHWLSWQLGLTATTAREKVRVARALRELPLTAAALGEGRVSYAQVRAITRVATAADEQTWVDLARHTNGAQLEKAVRGVAQAKDPAPDAPAKPAAQVRWDDDGSMVLTMRFAPHEAVAVLAALEQRQAAEQTDRETRLTELAVELAGCAPAEASVATSESAPAEAGLAAQAGGAPAESSEVPGGDAPAEAGPVLPDPDAYVDPPYPMPPPRDPFTPLPAEHAQAIADWWTEHHRLSALRDAARAQQERLRAEAAARHLPTERASLADGLVRALLRPGDSPGMTLKLLVDPVSGWARTSRDELLPPSTLKALLRTLPGQHQLPQVRSLQASDLTRHDLGRRSRVVSPALRVLLGRLDGERCRFPGCDHMRFLHAHHIKYWRHGGRTDLANLLLVCSRHHQLIHDHGYQLTLHPDRTLHVHTADSAPLPHHPALPHAPAEALPLVAAETLPSEWGGESIDLGYVVSVMLQHAA
jgi:hypothetical protein